MIEMNQKRQTTDAAQPVTDREAAVEPVRITSELFATCFDAARLAPSPDNNQPWAFRQTDRAIEILHVRSRAIRSDVRDLFSWLALGSAIENVVLAASQVGFRAAVAYDLPPKSDASLETVGTVQFWPDGPPDPLADYMVDRITNRRPYRKVPVSRETRDRLEAAADRPGCRVQFITDRAAIRRLAGMVQAADRIRFEVPTFHQELFEVLRFDRSEVEQTRDGLDVRTLEIPRPMWPLVRWLHTWPRMRRMNRLGVSRAFAKMSAQQARASGGLCLLSTKHPTDEGFLECGRAMQRLWLAATAEGLAVQPLGSVPLFLMKLDVEPESLADRHRASLQRIKADLADLVELDEKQVPAMLLRLGFAKSPSARSLRYQSEKLTAK